MQHMRLIKTLVLGATTSAILAGCQASGDYQGLEYAPNMYHSVGYEPLSQITDESAGAWVETLENREGEYFNSNKFNPHRMNMRTPPANTVKRNAYGWLPYRVARVPKDSVDIVVAGLTSPLANDSSAVVLAQGKALYTSYCQHCHGAKGEGDGKVADKYAGVANLQGDTYKVMSEAHIFQVITNGAGLMQPHGSQISPEDRWKITKYVKALQKK